MRQFGRMKSGEEAQRLVDYLLTQGIPTRAELDEDDGEWVLWVYDEDQLDLVARELSAFRGDPNQEKYLGHEAEAEAIRKQAVAEELEARRNYVEVRQRWSSARIPARSAPVAIVVIVVCGLLYLAGQQAWPWLAMSRIPFGSGLVEIRSGEVWRLLTPIFMHGSLMHIVFNLLLFWQLGSIIEFRKGSLFFLFLLLVSGVGGNVAQYLWSGGGTNFLGMSGVVYGAFGYVWMKSKFDMSSGMWISPRFVRILLIWLLVGFTPLPRLILGAGIANGAHVGGLIAGVVLGYLPVLLGRAGKV